MGTRSVDLDVGPGFLFEADEGGILSQNRDERYLSIYVGGRVLHETKRWKETKYLPRSLAQLGRTHGLNWTLSRHQHRLTVTIYRSALKKLPPSLISASNGPPPYRQAL